MSQHKIKFIAADMDGTLLDENGKLDPSFFNLYQELKEKDIMFAAASGRQYYSLIETFVPIKDDMMFIAENGTLVMHKGEELYTCTIDGSAVKEIIQQVRFIQGAHLVLCGKKSAYIETQDSQALEEIQKYYHRCESVDDLLLVEDEFIKVAVCHFDGTEHSVFPSLNVAFGDTHKVVVSGRIWLDIMNVVASKGAAIERLQGTLGFSREETMCFGDYFNDVEMLEASGHSYAVENAHEEIKKLARFRAPSNRDKGVFTVIREYLDQVS
jgi:Cof subfamily protein (haloacid dehalogenase superfamily)